jgi:hypothetical protein
MKCYSNPRVISTGCSVVPSVLTSSFEFVAELAFTPRPRHSNGIKTTVELDASNRIVLSRELRRAAGIPRRQKLLVSATPGRIVLEVEANTSGRIIKRGKLKVWTGAVPSTPIEEAVDQSRHYSR